MIQADLKQTFFYFKTINACVSNIPRNVIAVWTMMQLCYDLFIQNYKLY